VIYRKNSACRRARAGTFFFPGLVASGVQLDITAATSPKPKVLQTSQFNFMAYTVPPSAVAYRARHLSLSFISPILRPYHPPFENFSTRHPRNFQITSPFSSSFLKIHPLPGQLTPIFLTPFPSSVLEESRDGSRVIRDGRRTGARLIRD